jgi:uncharacterized protein YegP (UPF0339 family)
MRKLKIEVLKGDSGKWYWRIIGSNGKIMGSSETYSSNRKAMNSAVKIMTAEFTILPSAPHTPA